VTSKRMLDLALLLPTAPVFGALVLVLAIGVRVCDGAPVFFRQPRNGIGRRRFGILKLRTMTTEADPTERTVTRFGRFLRQRGLDELPQLWNVLVGDMSLVGPRPLTDDDADRLLADHPPFAARFEVAPGLTGLAQACQSVGVRQTAGLDALYAVHRSAALDVRILLRTLWMNAVGKRRGKLDAVRVLQEGV